MDLAALQTALAGLGPWGILIGAGIAVAVQWFRNRNAQPTPGPNPGPQPAPNGGTPLLDALLNLIKLRLLKKVQPVSYGAAAPTPPADVDDATIEAMLRAMQTETKLRD